MLRTHELHPTLVHFPLTLVPTAIALDAIGEATDNHALMKAGKTLMPAAAVSAVLAGVAGFIAQGSAKAEGRAHDLLVTHRNLNAALIGTTAAMAIYRQTRERPGLAYLLLGAVGMAGMTYTAYLGGKMVYAHGVGVEPDGVNIDNSPELRPGELARVARESARRVGEQARASVEEIRAGQIAPAMRSHKQGGTRSLSTGDGATPSM